MYNQLCPGLSQPKGEEIQSDGKYIYEELRAQSLKLTAELIEMNNFFEGQMEKKDKELEVLKRDIDSLITQI